MALYEGGRKGARSTEFGSTSIWVRLFHMVSDSLARPYDL
jgi:hypothetical protein